MVPQLVFVLLVLGLASATMVTIPVRLCTSQGTLHTVQVENCRNYMGPRNPCRMQRGTTPTIRIAFTPSHNLEKLISKAYWRVNRMISLPWAGMDNNACTYLTPTPQSLPSEDGCSLDASTRYNYTYMLPISRWVPGGAYLVKWTLQDVSGNNQVCFLVNTYLN